jgi:hypothetical protein
MKTYRIVVTDEEINEQMNRGTAAEETGDSKYSGMSYEQGVRDALEWIVYGGDKPLPDDDFAEEVENEDEDEEEW